MDELRIPAEPVAQAADDVRANFVRAVENFVKLFSQLPERDRLFRLLELWGQATASSRDRLERILNQLTNRPEAPRQHETLAEQHDRFLKEFNAQQEKRLAARIQKEKDTLRDKVFFELINETKHGSIRDYFATDQWKAHAVDALIAEFPAQREAWEQQRRTWILEGPVPCQLSQLRSPS